VKLCLLETVGLSLVTRRDPESREVRVSKDLALRHANRGGTTLEHKSSQTACGYHRVRMSAARRVLNLGT
jgi:hypothetical protein